jgi:SAM-dependent methyltransferase
LLDEIQTAPAPVCPICAASGRPRFDGLPDLLFGAPGSWTIDECDACRALWLNPMPVPADIHRAYARYYTHAQAAPPAAAPVPTDAPRGIRAILRGVKDGYLAVRWGYAPGRLPAWRRALGWLAYLTQLRRAQADAMVTYLPWRGGGRLLDVGCGDGRQLALMRDLGWTAEGVDFDAKAVAAARARGLHVRVGSLADQHFPDGSFDAVTLSHVIEHVHEPLRLLQEIRRVLKPEGHLVVLTPNAAGMGRRLYGAAWRGLEPPRHLTVFSPRSLRLLFRQAGFAEARVRTKVKISFGIFSESEKLLRLGCDPALPTELTAATRLKCRLLQLLELAILPFWRSAGEEIVGSARKGR